jgi:hypothetical protein
MLQVHATLYFALVNKQAKKQRSKEAKKHGSKQASRNTQASPIPVFVKRSLILCYNYYHGNLLIKTLINPQ